MQYKRQKQAPSTNTYDSGSAARDPSDTAGSCPRAALGVPWPWNCVRAFRGMLMEAVGIGERLRRAREARGLTLDAVAASTHIRERYLEALEEERFEEIPGPAYVKGFLRNYAVHLGLPEDEIMGDVAAIHPELKRVSAAIPERWGARARRDVPIASALRAIGWTILIAAIVGAYVAYTR